MSVRLVVSTNLCNFVLETDSVSLKKKLTQYRYWRGFLDAYDRNRISQRSSLARGGGFTPPHCHADYRKYLVFSTYEPDFCTRMENSLPPLAVTILKGDLFLSSTEFEQKNRSNF